MSAMDGKRTLAQITGTFSPSKNEAGPGRYAYDWQHAKGCRRRELKVSYWKQGARARHQKMRRSHNPQADQTQQPAFLKQPLQDFEAAAESSS